MDSTKNITLDHVISANAMDDASNGSADVRSKRILSRAVARARTEKKREIEVDGVSGKPWADGYRSDPDDIYRGDWRLPADSRATYRRLLHARQRRRIFADEAMDAPDIEDSER